MHAGLDVDKFAPRLSFFFNAHNNFLEEVAKFRAARRMWARIMKEHFAAKNPRSLMLRFHTQTAGSTLTAQQPENNIVRTALQAMAAVLGGTQSLHTNGFDEALACPRKKRRASRCARSRSLAYETGAANTIDPLAGSYYIESLTNEIERRAQLISTRLTPWAGRCKRYRAGIHPAGNPERRLRISAGRRSAGEGRGWREPLSDRRRESRPGLSALTKHWSANRSSACARCASVAIRPMGIGDPRG